ncbi:hypothetical protein Ae201684P_002740 [Aphanomyces euteiches]|nr:hypothetical protein Ae201684P_002740 [Aphanomyces euteiches]
MVSSAPRPPPTPTRQYQSWNSTPWRCCRLLSPPPQPRSPTPLMFNHPIRSWWNNPFTLLPLQWWLRPLSYMKHQSCMRLSSTRPPHTSTSTQASINHLDQFLKSPMAGHSLTLLRYTHAKAID